MSVSARYLFILNPKSFWNKWKWDQVLSKIQFFFEMAGDKNCALHVSRFPRDAIGFIHSHSRDLPEGTKLRVYAVGGDGILFDCLNGIMGIEQAELGVIPYGHTNVFIQGFGKHGKAFFRDLKRQFDAPAIPMDVMRYGNNYAISSCIVGTGAAALHNFSRMREKLSKGRVITQYVNRQLYTPLYYLGGLSACSDKNLLSRKYTVDIDGEVFSDVYRNIAVFNAAYCSNGLRPVSNAAPNDGAMNVIFAARNRGILWTYFTLPFYVTGRSGLFPNDFISRSCRKISVKSDETLVISLDGEIFFDSQLSVELLPAAVRFLDASGHGYNGRMRNL
ncbi:MAG: hypothetical protein FWG99_08980 [Treponema sp.]|nr:hypothetical protein [Treponema sp.]